MREVADVLIYVAGGLLILWGGAHLAPTARVADSFGAISLDNRRILVMEWIAEGLTHIALGVLVILTATLASSADSAAHLLYRGAAALLIALAALTALTGARTSVIWFRLCPSVLTTAAVLLLTRSTL